MSHVPDLALDFRLPFLKSNGALWFTPPPSPCKLPVLKFDWLIVLAAGCFDKHNHAISLLEALRHHLVVAFIV